MGLILAASQLITCVKMQTRWHVKFFMRGSQAWKTKKKCQLLCEVSPLMIYPIHYPKILW